MPEGISVVVDDEGYANITFENRALRGPALAKLIKYGGPDTVEKRTPDGYPVYRVPEGNARAAGLLDEPATVVRVAADGAETPSVPDGDDGSTPPEPDTTVPSTGDSTPPAPAAYPEGDPTTEWDLAQLKAYASDHGHDAHELRSKAKVLALINGK